jgi:hypothetical protein
MTNDLVIHLPTAEMLDSGHHTATSGWCCDLYLIPAGESDDGIPRVVHHCGLGNVGKPMPAFHGRWALIGSYGPMVTGDSVLRELTAMADDLVARSDDYRGAEWDGGNHRGRWMTADVDTPFVYLDESELVHYWAAEDWYGAVFPPTWESLAEDAGMDPRRALTEDIDELCDELAAAMDPQDEPVQGTAGYAARLAREYLSEEQGVTR